MNLKLDFLIHLRNTDFFPNKVLHFYQKLTNFISIKNIFKSFFQIAYSMMCSICQKGMNLSEGINEHDGQKCHVLCKEQYEKSWRNAKGLEDLY